MTRLLGLFFFAVALSAQYIPPGGSGGGVPTGAAGGSLAGTYPNPSLATLAQDLLFTDATYDIGKTGATRPRDIFLSRNLAVGPTVTIDGTTGAVAGAVIPASAIASGTLGTARLGSGTANSAAYLRGDSTWVTSATIASTSAVVKGDSAGNIVAATAGTDYVGGQASVGAVVSSVPRATAAGLLADSFLGCSGTPMVCTAYDSTASTGATRVVIRGGAGQSTTIPFQILDVNGSTNLFSVSAGGVGTFGGNVSGAAWLGTSDVKAGASGVIYWMGRSEMKSLADGRINLLNTAETGFTRLTLGPETASFPAFLVTTQVNPIVTCVDGTGASTCQFKANSYLSSDGTAGVTVTTCTGYKNGLCISGT